ncbi:MAG: DinB family protein, partial [Blastocatellia bacterium]|nr:DinB family protein [Blastocatellia bacterium]
TNPASSSVEQASAYVIAVLGLLGERNPIDVIQTTASALERIRQGLPLEQVRQAEAPGKWSIGQVLQHLADSDLVWGYRLRMVLAHDRPRLTGYDQDKWAERLGYDEADPDQSLQDFGNLRRANLRLLSRATSDDLKRVGLHSERGEESVEHMIRLYAGHDLLHLEQLARIRRAVTPSA